MDHAGNNSKSEREKRKRKLNFPNITVDELLSDDFFLEEKMRLENSANDSSEDEFKLNFNNLDQITKSILKNLQKFNYTK